MRWVMWSGMGRDGKQAKRSWRERGIEVREERLQPHGKEGGKG
jgi:hypothetical protein